MPKRSTGIFKNATLRTQLIFWFLMVALIPLIVVSVLSVISSSSALEEENIEKLTIAAEVREEEILLFLDRVLDLTTQVEKEVHSEAIAVIRGTGDGSVLNEKLAEEAQFSEVPAVFDVLNSSGRVVASSVLNDVGEDRSSEGVFQEGLKDEYVSTMHYELHGVSGENTRVQDFAIPIRSSGSVVGVFVGDFNTSHVNDLLIGSALEEGEAQTSIRGIGTTGELYLVNEHKTMISDSLFVQDAAFSQVVDTYPVQMCLSEGKEVSGIWKDYRGNDVAGSAMCITAHGLNWTLVSEQSQSESLEAAMALRTLLIVFGVIIAAVVVLLAYLISRSISRVLSRSVDDITDTVSVLNQSTMQTASAAEQNSKLANDFAQSSTEQAKEVGEISKSMTQMSSASDQMATSVQQMSETAMQTLSMVQDTSQLSQQSQEGLEGLKASSQSTAAQVREMADKSGAIAEIVESITSIAQQTNLLALNAAIEAARAGDAGRGFAVVADEVRKLAEESATAADATQEQIRSMIAQIQEVAASVETGTTQTDERVGAVMETLKKLEGVTVAVQTLTSKTQEISAGIQENAAGVRQVSKSVETISAAADQAASGAQQITSSASQQSAAAQQVAATTQQLKAVSEGLGRLAGAGGGMDSARRRKVPAYLLENQENGVTPSSPLLPSSPEEPSTKNDSKKS